MKPTDEVLLYQTEDGMQRLEVRLDGDTVWLSLTQLAELFQRDKSVISRHIRNIYEERELKREATVANFATVQPEGQRAVTRAIEYFNLEVIISIGYRVKSPRGTQFRQWATTQLREYLVKGFVMDDARLKEPGGWDYFNELLARVRDIRASEKRFYQKVRDIFATAVDYQADSEQAQIFFKKVQNKMLWATTGHTAAELIAQRANAAQPHMGLTTFKGSRVRSADVTVAKNYLNEQEVAELNRIVVMYLDYAEDQAQRRQTTTMQQWASKLDAFLQFNERDVLTHAGKVRAEVAEKLALERYAVFDEQRKRVEARDADEVDIAALERSVEQLTSTQKRMKKEKR